MVASLGCHRGWLGSGEGSWGSSYSHPLQGPAQGMTWELQKEQGALERRRRSAEAREARQAASADGVGPRDQVRRDKVPRAFHAQRPTKAPASSCFGQKIDPISHHSGLGCNGELLSCHPGPPMPPPFPWVSPYSHSEFVVSWHHTLRKGHLDVTLADRPQGQGVPFREYSLWAPFMTKPMRRTHLLSTTCICCQKHRVALGWNSIPSDRLSLEQKEPSTLSSWLFPNCL